jgi:hypothetical protein
MASKYRIAQRHSPSAILIAGPYLTRFREGNTIGRGQFISVLEPASRRTSAGLGNHAFSLVKIAVSVKETLLPEGIIDGRR